MFFGELINSLMRDKQIYALKRRTYLRYEEIIRTQITPTLGNLYTADISANTLQSFQKQKLDRGNVITGKPLANNTVKNMMSIVKNAMEYGRELGVRIGSAQTLAPIKFEEKPITVFRKDEQKRIEKTVFNSTKSNHFGIVLCL